MSAGDQPPPAYNYNTQYGMGGSPGYPTAPAPAPYPAQPAPAYAPPQYDPNMPKGPPPPGAAPYPMAPAPGIQPAYPPHQQPATVNVAVVAPGAVHVNRALGTYSTQVTCPSCQAFVSTNVRYETGALTWLLCLGLCFIGCDLGCCFIPFFVDQCKDAYHTCPNCNASIGRHNAL